MTGISRRTLLAGGILAAGAVAAPYLLRSARRPVFKIASSIYVGWMPWFHAAESGLVRQVAEKRGISVEFVRADYADTIAMFGAGAVDAVTMTNIDAAPAIVSSNIRADVILPGSFSHGNDAIMMRSPDAELAGAKLGLVEYSVSHYLLDRILEQRNIPYSSVKVLNVADSAIISSFVNRANDLDGVVTWNPLVDELQRRHGAHRLADSRAIPYEIADLLVVNRATRQRAPQFVAALLDIWFRVMEQMRADPAGMDDALGRLSGTDAAGYRRQLESTILSDTPQKALEVMQAGHLQKTSAHVKAFALRHKLVEQEPENWITFAGQQPGLLHYDMAPLQAFAAKAGTAARAAE